MLHRIIRSIHHFLAGALLLSSIAPLQAQTARQRLLSAGHTARGAVVGGVRYSTDWVNRKIEAGARNFPRWARRRVANTLSRFAKPTEQEREVIKKYVNGQQLSAAEAVTWKKFRNRALSSRGALAAIVAIVIAILATIAGTAVLVHKKREAREKARTRALIKESQRKEKEKAQERMGHLRRQAEQEMKEKIEDPFWGGKVILADGTQWYVYSVRDDTVKLTKRKDSRGESRKVNISDVIDTIDPEHIAPEKGLSYYHQQLRELTEEYNKLGEEESVGADELGQARRIAREAIEQAAMLKQAALRANDLEMIDIAEKAIADYLNALRIMSQSDEVGLGFSQLSLPQTSTQGASPVPRIQPYIPEVKLLKAKPSN